MGCSSLAHATLRCLPSLQPINTAQNAAQVRTHPRHHLHQTQAPFQLSSAPTSTNSTAPQALGPFPPQALSLGPAQPHDHQGDVISAAHLHSSLCQGLSNGAAGCTTSSSQQLHQLGVVQAATATAVLLRVQAVAGHNQPLVAVCGGGSGRGRFGSEPHNGLVLCRVMY